MAAQIIVSLAPELEAFVDSRIATGRYQSAAEVVTEGLRLLEQQELDRKAALDEVRAKIAVGLEQARRGELLDGAEVFRRLRERIGEDEDTA